MGRAESWAQLSRTFPMWEQGEKEEGGDAAHSKKKKEKRTNDLQEWAQSQTPPNH